MLSPRTQRLVAKLPPKSRELYLASYYRREASLNARQGNDEVVQALRAGDELLSALRGWSSRSDLPRH